MKFACRVAALAVVATFAFPSTTFAADKATQELYAAKCAKCHGADGTSTAVGKKLGVKDFSDPEVIKATDTDLIDATAKGKGKMPGYGKSLKEDQIKALVAYVREMNKKGK
jgi:mono/diheme cytochrome c family protein